MPLASRCLWSRSHWDPAHTPPSPQTGLFPVLSLGGHWRLARVGMQGLPSCLRGWWSKTPLWCGSFPSGRGVRCLRSRHQPERPSCLDPPSLLPSGAWPSTLGPFVPAEAARGRCGASGVPRPVPSASCSVVTSAPPGTWLPAAAWAQVRLVLPAALSHGRPLAGGLGLELPSLFPSINGASSPGRCAAHLLG